MKRNKRYNSATGFYKIDIFVDGVYYASTDWFKTCKEAKASYLEKHKNVTPDSVTCKFFYE